MKKYSALCLMLLVTACASSPDPDYFSLAAQPGEISSLATLVKIHQPALAGYLDRSEFVRQQDAYQLSIDDSAQWAEPLDKMFARILAADLQQRMPASTVLTEDDASPASVRYTIDMNIQRFNATNDGTILLQGEMIVNDSTTPMQPHFIPVSITVDSGSSASSIAAALSQAVATVSSQLTQNLLTLSKAAGSN